MEMSQRLVALTFAITRSAKNCLFKLSSRTSSKVSAVRFTKLPLPSDLRAPTRTTLPATTPTSPGGMWDYWCATNNLEFTDPLSKKLDSVLRSVLDKATGLNLFDPAAADNPLPWLTYERVELSTNMAVSAVGLTKNVYCF